MSVKILTAYLMNAMKCYNCARAIFSTCYMATENSSEATRLRAQRLAEEIGRYVIAMFVLLSYSTCYHVRNSLLFLHRHTAFFRLSL